MTRTNLPLAAALVVATAVLFAAPARAHDDARAHVHVPVNGAALYGADVVPASVWGVASLVVAASLLRRRRVAPRGA